MRNSKPKQIDHYQIRFDQEVFIDLFAGGGGASMGMEEAAGMPVYAADVVEVVRCKDCVHYEGVEHSCFHVDGLPGYCVAPNDFCCHGERKDG